MNRAPDKILSYFYLFLLSNIIIPFTLPIIILNSCFGRLSKKAKTYYFNNDFETKIKGWGTALNDMIFYQDKNYHYLDKTNYHSSK